MKCFNLFLVYLFFNLAFATDVILKSLSDEEVTLGDIVELEVYPESSLDKRKLLSYKNKRISNLLYVLDVKSDQNESLIFECLITESKQKEEQDREHNFKVRGINFKYKKMNLSKELETLTRKINYFKNKNLYIILSLFIFLFGVYVFAKVFKKIKKKKQLRSRQKELSHYFEKLETRIELEKFYTKRQVIKQFFFLDEQALVRFETFMNDNQYKQQWSDEQLKSALELIRPLLKGIKPHDRI